MAPSAARRLAGVISRRHITSRSIPKSRYPKFAEDYVAQVTSRRRFITGTTAAAALSLTNRAWARMPAPDEPAPQTPSEALARLVDGNRRYASNQMASCGANLGNLRRDTVAKQQPFAAILACADSRVPVELIFDQSIGQLFVTRLAGNIATTEIIASLEYAAAELGTSLILVMGHATCGAVKAAIANEAVPGQISALFRYMRPAIDEAGADLAAAIKANARIQANLLRQSSPILAEHVKQNTLRVVASYYDLGTGTVTMLDAT